MTDDAAPADRRTAADLLHRLGTASWSLIGIVVLALVAAAAVGAISGILVPLVVAVIIGIVLEPLSEMLQRRGVPAVLATVACLAVLLVVAAGTVTIVVVGFIDQWPEILRQINAGWGVLVGWLNDHGSDTAWLEHVRTAVEQHAPEVGQGVLGAVTSTVYGAVALVMGVFFSVFFLFFVLRDGLRFPDWFASTTSIRADEVHEVVDQCRQSLRGYFRGTAVTALVTAPIFVIPLLILEVPLVIPIFVLYFFLSFIPFLGAWITGVFAVLIAFGSGGTTAAIIIGVTFVISNGTIQSVVSSWALGSSLRIHPVTVLLATMVGGTVAGLLGMVLGAPVTAAVAKSVVAIRRLRAARDPLAAPECVLDSASSAGRDEN
ncbi:AI-2E family transporter [Gordonia hydrophobica]|uniref:AI-2E family transporter n=1 Tax=Gordonia hydrophobica TaxID=40516 RepID=A0ABZ2U131_9ACTN|nr:AI-2E family transporter [Gordonia hydrophobica]MBM7368482.1 putative PurR-regulated permease PerM [Gordonia hydrophobica]